MSTKSNLLMEGIPNGVDVANAIRNSASPAYQAAVPLADYGNITDVGNPIMNYQPLANEFLSALVNKIGLTIVNNKMFKNPLGYLKRGALPLGLDVEDVHINPAIAQQYGLTNADFAKVIVPEKPDVKAAYYRRNRQDKYKVTIANQSLRAAFTSWGNLEALIAGIVNSLYNGNTIGEFTLTKTLVGDAVVDTKINQVVLAAPTTEATATAFLTNLRGVSSGMTFPSSKYNNYTLMGGTGNPVVNWTDVEDQIIIVRADVAANVDVQKLAAVFNLSYADYSARQIIVDDFGAAKNMYAFIGSRRIFQIWENLRQMAEFYNGETLAWTYWWHCWDTYALSPYENGVAYVTSEYTPPEPTPGG